MNSITIYNIVGIQTGIQEFSRTVTFGSIDGRGETAVAEPSFWLVR